ncbi:MAG: hypothetical protein AB9903_20600 [Vulcanimicrobiota bacterium]
MEEYPDVAAYAQALLLRQIFAVSCAYSGEILSLAKIAREIPDTGTLETIANYLNVMKEAELVSPVRKYEVREFRKRNSGTK